MCQKSYGARWVSGVCYSDGMYKTYKQQKQREAGKRYERFVAQTLREQGWQVVESGLSGYDDHGIDLEATKDGVRRYVQCKGWKRHRLIHSDVVSQLFGDVANIEGVGNLDRVECYIYSPARLDEAAAAEAQRLGVRFVRLYFPPWHHHVRRYFNTFRQNDTTYSRGRAPHID